MSDEPEPTEIPLHTFIGTAGTANVRVGRGPGPKPGFEVWLNGIIVGWYENEAEALAVAKDVSGIGMDGSEPLDSEPMPGSKR